MPTTTGLDNPHDQHDDPLLHKAWREGAVAAQDGKDVGCVQGLYDDPEATLAFLNGYRAVAVG